PEDLAENASRSLAKLGVEVRCGAMVKDVDKEGLTIDSGGRPDSIAAKTVIWPGGITPSPLGKILASHTKAETDKGGRVKVKPDLTIPGYPDIYVVGDLASAMNEKGNPCLEWPRSLCREEPMAPRRSCEKLRGSGSCHP